jgi:hypothetical protein
MPYTCTLVDAAKPLCEKVDRPHDSSDKGRSPLRSEGPAPLPAEADRH